MTFLYIIYSRNKNRYYTGITDDLEDRLYRHINSGSKSTKSASDWVLVYKEEYSNRSEALKRENQIKKMKSRKYIERLIVEEDNRKEG